METFLVDFINLILLSVLILVIFSSCSVYTLLKTENLLL